MWPRNSSQTTSAASLPCMGSDRLFRSVAVLGKCGHPLPPRSRTGPPRVWCSEACAKRGRYRIWWQSRNRDHEPAGLGQPAPRGPCPTCGATVVQRRNSRGKRKRFCSTVCRKASQPNMWRKARIARRAEAKVATAEQALARIAARTTACGQCGALFVGYARGSRYCSRECFARWQLLRVAGPPRVCVRCSHSYVPRQPRQRYCSANCREATYRGRGADLLRRKGRAKVRRLRNAVLARDGWICGVCNLPIRQGLEWNHPLALTIDHITPLGAGGRDVIENLQPAHRQCNVEKSDSIVWWRDRQRPAPMYTGGWLLIGEQGPELTNVR